MALTRCYFGLDVATLQQMQTDTLNAIAATKKRGNTFSAGETSMSFPDLAVLQQELAEINAALAAARGKLNPITVGKIA